MGSYRSGSLISDRKYYRDIRDRRVKRHAVRNSFNNSFNSFFHAKVERVKVKLIPRIRKLKKTAIDYLGTTSDVVPRIE
ncbi:hypothetical protein PUN28_019935 [Cardiocondyla obscurior]|uniref:Uncharacterized protein n=1 Tax=Cardiocondyla obscurior TaxID=286306 RepID=A0AAW2E846_9HYME